MRRGVVLTRAAAVCGSIALATAGCQAEEPDAAASPTGSAPGASTASTTSATATSSPVAVGDWSLALDSRPMQATSSADRIFLTTAGFRYPPQIYAIDATTGAVVEKRTAVGQPYDMAVAPDGRLWVVGDRHPDQPSGAGINVFDPDSLLVAEHLNLPEIPRSLVQVGDEIWVGASTSVYVLDPATLTVVRTVAVRGPVSQLLALPDDDGAVVVGATSLQVLGTDGAVRAEREVDADGALRAAISDDAIWVRTPVSTDSTVVAYGLDLAAAGRPTGVETDSAGGGLVVSGGGVVLVDDRGQEVVCLSDLDAPPVRSAADDAIGVLATAPDDRLVLATDAGITLRPASCS